VSNSTLLPAAIFLHWTSSGKPEIDPIGHHSLVERLLAVYHDTDVFNAGFGYLCGTNDGIFCVKTPLFRC